MTNFTVKLRANYCGNEKDGQTERYTVQIHTHNKNKRQLFKRFSKMSTFVYLSILSILTHFINSLVHN